MSPTAIIAVAGGCDEESSFTSFTTISSKKKELWDYDGYAGRLTQEKLRFLQHSEHYHLERDMSHKPELSA